MSSGCAIIIGVSYMPGLGHAIAKRFAEGGLSVGIIGRNAERLKAVQARRLYGCHRSVRVEV
eukprot:6181099-Pleurochrysis_carterae.AAC.1